VKAWLVMLQNISRELGFLRDGFVDGRYLLHNCLADVLGNGGRDESVSNVCGPSGMFAD